ncbi:RWD domain-containing protein 3 isoform X2 [Parasteatoda tepidariorum]|uniref:RWD domain-containing protein 3 isoform X2 n=1 Tax=Parasteatoda tepidariorum TaxID=114398 RepID=UPI0039BC2EF8
MESFTCELEWLKASYNPEEMEHFVSRNSTILKFTLHQGTFVTFEIPERYPQEAAHLSICSSEMTNSEKCAIEKDIRNYALQLIGRPMIMDLVTKTQELFRHHCVVECKRNEPTLLEQEDYIAVISIDHMRQRRKYSKTLQSWACELNICGILLFCQKWIYLILEGLKNDIKEFIVRHKTIPVDVDSSGKPCKEKMCKVIFEGKQPKVKKPTSNPQNIRNLLQNEMNI